MLLGSVRQTSLGWATAVRKRHGILYACLWLCPNGEFQHAKGRVVAHDELLQCVQCRCERCKLEVRGGERERRECGEAILLE